MSGDRIQARSVPAIKRAAEIQLGLGVLALIAAATGTWWLLQGRLPPTVWIGVAGALTSAVSFLAEGRRACEEYTQLHRPDAAATVRRLAAPGPAEQHARGANRRRLLGFMIFGIVASVGGPGLNVLLRILSRGGASNLDLLAWVLFTLPICLAVWMLPPRGPGARTGQSPG